MKYTVVIRQPVEVGMRQVLEKQLMERFGLSGDQAQRLSARRAGRLMKPTGRSRAELLLSVFNSVGAEVSLEEVREETGLLTEPFQGVSTPIAPRPTPPLDVHDDAPLAPLLAPEDRPQDLFRTPAASWPDVAPTPNDRENASDLRWDTPLPTTWPDFGNSGNSGGSSAGQAAVLNAPTISPSADTLISQAPPDRTPNTNLLGTFLDFSSPQPATPRGGEPVAPAPSAPAPRAPSDPVTTTDVWTDFTGSLTMVENQTMHDARVTSITPISPVLVPAVNESAEPSREGRSSLARQLVIGTLTPLAVSTLLTLGVLFLTMPNLASTTLLLVLAVSLLGLGLAAWLAVRAARQVTEPIERLVKAADAISMGDLTRPVPVERNDEIGDLAHALERMRLSLEAAMERLRRRQRRETRFK